MTARNPFALHGPAEPAGTTRWAGSAVAIMALHLGLIGAAIAWYQQPPSPGVAVPAILVDLAPATASPQPQPLDLAPGPLMHQGEAPAPPQPVEPEPVPQQTAPPQDKAEVVLPPEPKTPPPPKPEPAKLVPDHPKPAPAKPNKLLRAEPKRPSEQEPSPRTTAPLRAERQASLSSAASAGALAAALLPSYRDRLAAHLQRFKQYPAASRAAGEQGVAMLSFTVGRGGQLLGSRLARSSGSAALDAETQAMLRRAQPLPAFPPELPGTSLNFTVPVRFSIR